MKIGLFFGSFNPIHTGHLIIANHILNETDLQKIWFILSPQNPFKASSTLLNEYDRLQLLHLATNGDDRLKASDIEFSLPKPSYTSTTLAYLRERYAAHEFSIIMGSDSYRNLKNWKNADAIIGYYRILVYQRPTSVIEQTQDDRVFLLQAPSLEISATYIRETIQQGKSIQYLVPDKVKDEIERSGFYKRPQKI